MNTVKLNSLRKEKYNHTYKKRAISSVPNRKVIRYKCNSNENNFDLSEFSFFKNKTVEIINTSYIGLKRECSKDLNIIQERQHQAIPSMAYLPIPKKNLLTVFSKVIGTSNFN